MLSIIETLPPNPLAGFDQNAAAQEGWTLSETCDFTDAPGVQLQALDPHELPTGVTTLFRSDRAAWDHVAIRARQGSALHRDALNRLDPVELAMIETLFGPI